MEGGASINHLPMSVVGVILSLLPLPDIIRCAAVSREWRDEVRTANSIAVVDIGSLFAGTTAPDALVLDRVARSVKGRDYCFADCVWLTSGALMHVIGVPFAIAPLAPLPPLPRQSGDLGEAQRRAAADALAAGPTLAPAPTELAGADADAGADAGAGAGAGARAGAFSGVGAGGPPPAHSFLRLFLSEFSDAELVAQGVRISADGADGAPAEAVEARAEGEQLRGAAAAAAAAATAVSATATDQDTIAMASAEVGAGAGSKPAQLFPGGSGAPASAAAAGTARARASVPWWRRLAGGLTSALRDRADAKGASDSAPALPPAPAPAPACAWLPHRDLCLAFVQSEVVKSRAMRGHDELVRAAPMREAPYLQSTQAFGAVVARAYLEMALALRAALHAHAEGGFVPAGGDATAAGAAAAAGVDAGAFSSSSFSSTSSFSTSFASASSSAAAAKPAPTLLVSGRQLLNSPPVVAASTLFQPVADIRARAKRDAEQEALAEARAARARSGLTAAAVRGLALPPSLALPGGGGGGGAGGAGSGVAGGGAELAAAIFASDAITAGAIGDIASQHALSVAYATAVGDMFAFPLQLAERRHARARLEAAGAGAAGVAAADAVAEGTGVAFDGPTARVEGGFCSFDVPAPVLQRHSSSSVNAAAAAAIAAFTAGVGPGSGGGGGGAGARGLRGAFNALNAVGVGAGADTSAAADASAPLPPTFVAGVTGLDLHGCVRLAPQCLPIVLRFCAHLTVLRLGGCSQFSATLLAASLPLVPRLTQLDLEYCDKVNDEVLVALGRHCPSLQRLQLVGAHLVTDRGLGEEGLLRRCTRIKRLNLRGLRSVTDAGVLSISQRCPHLRELVLSGIVGLTAAAIAQLILRCRRLDRLKAELWFDAPPAPGEDPVVAAALAAAAAAAGDPTARKHYRLLATVRGAIRYIRSILPAGNELHEALGQRYREPHVPAGFAAAGAGAALPVPDARGVEGSELMTPPLQRRGEGDSVGSAGGGSVDERFFGEVARLVEGSLGAGTAGGIAAATGVVPPAPRPASGMTGADAPAPAPPGEREVEEDLRG